MIEYVNAGHTPPLWLSRNGVVELGESDLLLGVVSRAEFTTRRLQLEPGDSLILFTDGVTEARDRAGIDLGSMIIADALAPLHGADANTISTSVNESVLQHVGDAENLDDDVTLLIVSRAS
jgi:sigma-B regulation protein RsbU (phosphoserine phosphatase)